MLNAGGAPKVSEYSGHISTLFPVWAGSKTVDTITFGLENVPAMFRPDIPSIRQFFMSLQLIGCAYTTSWCVPVVFTHVPV